MDAAASPVATSLPRAAADGAPDRAPRPRLETAAAPPSTRIVSIDAFRGFTILAMIFVNRVADYDVANQFKHALNYGLTFTDLVEPFFIFLVGLCIPLALGRRSGAERRRKLISRTFMLFVLGIAYVSLRFHEVRLYWGVLQAIGVGYLLAGLLMNFSVLLRVATVLGILALHSLLLLKWPFYKAMTFEEGGSLPWHIQVLTINGGIPGALASSGIAILGTVAGDILRTKPPHQVFLRSLLRIGVFCCLGGALASAVRMHGVRPFSPNKGLATAGYVLISTGISSLVLATFYVVVDLWGYRRWTWPLQVFSSNALLAYFLQPVLKVFVAGFGLGELWDTGYDPRSIIAAFNRWGLGKVAGGYVAGLCWVLLLWVVVYSLNRKKFFIRV